MSRPLAPHFHRPRIGDKFWDRDVFVDEKKQPNGKVHSVDWSNKEVVVLFMDGNMRTYDLWSIMDSWEASSFGGCFMLYRRITREERLKLARGS